MAADKASQQEASEGGFLSRWSQRKQALSKGVALAEPALPVKNTAPINLMPKEALAPVAIAQDATDSIANDVAKPELPPPPTMEDVHALTPQSDFKPFMRADVLPQVKNAAMKQLFRDPHFNVMDMMDIYVDDYSKPDPLPPEMLRKMAVTQFLGFWKEEEEEAAKKVAEEIKAREDAQAIHKETVAQSDSTETASHLTDESHTAAYAAPVSQTPHDHPDLQLQPNDAAGQSSIVPSAG